MKKFFLKTKDGIGIAADLYPAENPAGFLILLHMMPATKELWRELAEYFQNLKYESLAIDLRGHGESDEGPDGFLKFSDKEHQKSAFDVEAAAEFLANKRRARPKEIIFIGASIGANLSLQFIIEHPEFKTAVLLSGGLNYRGVRTEPLAENLRPDQKVFFMSSKDDGDNAEQNQKLYDLTPENVKKEIRIYETGGHGTDILKNRPESFELIKNFVYNE